MCKPLAGLFCLLIRCNAIATAGIQPGGHAASLRGKALSGRSVNLSVVRGEVVVISF